LQGTELGRGYGKPEIGEVKEVDEVKEVKEAERKTQKARDLASWRVWHCLFTRNGSTKK
jgi:hypothetical protein